MTMIKISDPFIGKEEMEAARRVLGSSVLARGNEIKKFEEAFSRYTDTKHAIATSNGTTALHAALLANGIGKGDEVITPSFSFVASANSILYTGARPVFADVNREDFNIDTGGIEEKITKDTKALMVVHLYGQTCDMRKITKLCSTHGLILIEDACQAHGAEYAGKMAGSFGTGCFSFYATKNMTTGEGGMITTDDDRVADKARMIISHGSSRAYDNKILGYNFRMTEIQAAIGASQLQRLDTLNKKRIENAALLTKKLASTGDLELPAVMKDRKHVFHQYTIKSSKRDEIMKMLEKSNVGYGIYYPRPIHKQDFYTGMGYKDKLPVSERLSQEVLSLPVHPKVTRQDIDVIASCVGSAFA